MFGKQSRSRRFELETLEARTVPSTMAADFTDGIWRWDSNLGWAHISTEQATKLTVDDQGNVFGILADGVWRWNQNTGWARISDHVAEDIAVTSSGVFYGDFGPIDTWRWAAGNWARISDLDPTSITVSRKDSFFGVYSAGVPGTWNWTLARGWTLLSPNFPDQMASDDAGELVGLFDSGIDPSVQGTWRWSPTAGWARLSMIAPVNIAVASNGVIYENRDVAGLWELNLAVGPAFKQISGNDAILMSALPSGDLFITTMNPQGWYFSVASQSWKLANVNTLLISDVVAGKDNDLFFNEGAVGGVHRFSISTGDTQLSVRNPTNLASQR
jgi:hypothetical protein